MCIRDSVSSMRDQTWEDAGKGIEECNPISKDKSEDVDPLISGFLRPSEPERDVLIRKAHFSLDEAIEIAGHGNYQHQVFALLALTWALVLSITESAIPFIISGAKEEWDLSGVETGAIGFGLVLGGTLGSVCGGWMCDTYGRKSVVLYGSIWALCFHALCSLTPSWEMLALCRMTFGLAIAAVSNSCKVIIAEVYIAELRGRWNALIHLFWQLGGVVLITITFFLSDSQWRLLVVITSLPGISVVVLQSMYLRETSRFKLERKGVYKAMSELEFIAECNGKTIPCGKLIPPPVSSKPTPKCVAGLSMYMGQMFHPTRVRSTVTLGVLFILLSYSSFGNSVWFKELFKRQDRDHLVQPVYYALFIGKMIGVPICWVLILSLIHISEPTRPY
eukprot:TRINITY_DN2121_c0_g1_i2.p1 TRINITY_DN2121_c0_g1~~TRINITY_DN2121_c0_g1_i2.p1  ORF type:complete len:391 (-),score=76.91 TRINITY_DN2121_c0_g1_i2:94-1266(-)